MEESNITNFKKDNFSINCKYNPDKKATTISKEYIDDDTTYTLDLYVEDKDFTFEYDKETRNLLYLNTSYFVAHNNHKSIIMFEYPGLVKNQDTYEICLIKGNIDEENETLNIEIQENFNHHRINQTKRNNVTAYTYESLSEKFGVFMHSYYKPNYDEISDENEVIQIILDVADRKIVYEKDNEEEILYELLDNKEKVYETKLLYKNIENEIIDRKGNVILTGDYSLFNIFINPYINKLDDYVSLVLNNFPSIDKNMFKYDNLLLDRGYNNYLFPNIDKDISVKDILKKIKTKNGSKSYGTNN